MVLFTRNQSDQLISKTLEFQILLIVHNTIDNAHNFIQFSFERMKILRLLNLWEGLNMVIKMY